MLIEMDKMKKLHASEVDALRRKNDNYGDTLSKHKLSLAALKEWTTTMQDKSQNEIDLVAQENVKLKAERILLDARLEPLLKVEK